jgi:hypothetical protein
MFKQSFRFSGVVLLPLHTVPLLLKFETIQIFVNLRLQVLLKFILTFLLCLDLLQVLLPLKFRVSNCSFADLLSMTRGRFEWFG